MNENLANEIRKTIESIKDMKTQVGGINNYLSILEELLRHDSQKKVDDAYQQGYNKGYADKTNNDKVCKELAKDNYQRGLDDAWECARKLYLKGACKDLFGEYFNTFIKNHTAQEAIAKLKAYEEKLKADDKIKVGDVVERYIDGKFDSTGIYLGENGYYWKCLFWTGVTFCAFSYPKNQFKKTGIRIDIDKIKEKMRNE